MEFRTNKSATNAIFNLNLDRVGIHTDADPAIMARAAKSQRLIGGKGLAPCPMCGVSDLVVEHPDTGDLYSDCRCGYRKGAKQGSRLIACNPVRTVNTHVPVKVHVKRNGDFIPVKGVVRVEGIEDDVRRLGEKYGKFIGYDVLGGE